MNGAYQSHIRREERIAADVETYRWERFPGLQIRSFSRRLYPFGVYSPTRHSVRRLRRLGLR